MYRVMATLLCSSLDRITVRNGPARLRAKFLLRFERPVGFPQQLPRQENQVGIAPGHDFVRLLCLRNQADGASHHTRFFFDLPRKWYLISLAYRNASFWDERAGGNVDQIDAQFLEPA